MKRAKDSTRRRKVYKRKKAAIQISMSFTVMLLMAIVVFILSLLFLSDFFQGVTKLKATLDEQTRSQINAMLAGNARIAIPLERKDTKPGESVAYGVGIKNTLTNESFRVEFAYPKSGKFIPIEDPDSSYDVTCRSSKCSISGYTNPRYQVVDSIFYQIGRQGELEIGINEDDIVTVSVQPIRKAPLGHFIMNLEICSGSSMPSNCVAGNYYDGSIHKLHLIVK